MRKYLCFLLSFVILLVPVLNLKADTIELTTECVVLMEANTGEILYESNPEKQVSIASITKVMTLILTMEALDSGKLSLDDTLTASAHASSMGGSDIWLKDGEQMSVKDLIKATVVMSANDAAVVLAEEIGGSEENFVVMMNEKSKSLGMENTTFKNCNGLDEDGHLSCAKDVAIMSRELMKHEEIFEYTQTWIDYVRDGATQLVNTNKLLKSYKGITGLKTGTTSIAGSCISATATRNGMSLIAVVLGAVNTDTRFSEAKKLLDYGFANWSISNAEFELPDTVEITNGMETAVKIEVKGTSETLCKSSDKAQLKAVVQFNEEIIAPIEIGDNLGEVQIFIGENLVKKLPILAKESAEELSFFKVFAYLFSHFAL